MFSAISFQLYLAATLSGQTGENAVWRVVEDLRNAQGPAPIPLHPAVDQLASSKTWDQLSKLRHVTQTSVVSFIFTRSSGR